MAIKAFPQTVADAFVKQYYVILNQCPENAHKFYQETSILGWPGPDGVLTSVTSLTGINDKIMSSADKNCTMEIKTSDAQESLDGGIIIAVTGLLTEKDNMKKNFFQTFFLAKQENGFYVLNDILRFDDVTYTAADIDDQSAPPVQESDNEIVVEDGDNKEAFDHSVSEDTAAQGASSTAFVASGEKENPAVARASNKRAHSAAKTSKKKKRSAVTLGSDEKACLAIEPALNENLPEVAALASTEKLPELAAPDLTENLPEVAAPASTENLPEVAASASSENLPEVAATAATENSPAVVAATSTEKEPSDEIAHLDVVLASDEKAPSAAAPASIIPEKITYASVVAKEAPAASPRTVKVITEVNKRQAPSPMAKESAVAGKDAPKIDAYAESTGIYIGRLPYNITKQGIIDVIKKFGPVRRKPDAIQIRRHEDGFCCGFAEFESAESARRAVEAHRIKFGETESYIAYKRTSAYRRNEAGGGRSPTRAGNISGWDDSRTNSYRGQSRHSQRGRSSGQWSPGESYRLN